MKFQNPSELKPEWDITSIITDGLTPFMQDIYQILTLYPHGMYNYRYPILQFALKGLLLLDLIKFDSKRQLWFNIDDKEGYNIRFKIMDQFINQQINLKYYEKNLDSNMINQDWYLGIVCFDFLSINSIFLKRFYNNKGQISEDEKFKVIKKYVLKQKILKKLDSIEIFDPLGVNSLRKKLK